MEEEPVEEDVSEVDEADDDEEIEEYNYFEDDSEDVLY